MPYTITFTLTVPEHMAEGIKDEVCEFIEEMWGDQVAIVEVKVDDDDEK